MNQKIYQIRKNEKLSQADFGKRIGISGAAISRIESGENSPSDQTIKLICSEFGINPDWMAGIEGADMKLTSEDADFAAVLRAMTGGSETKKQLLRIVADMPDELLEAVHQYFIATKNTPKA